VDAIEIRDKLAVGYSRELENLAMLITTILERNSDGQRVGETILQHDKVAKWNQALSDICLVN
jgi:hypothetical protein